MNTSSSERPDPNANEAAASDQHANPNAEAAYRPPQTVAITSDSEWAEHRTWLVAMHLSGLSLYVISLIGLVIPLALWLAKKAEHPVIDRQGREALNFQLTFLLAGFLLGVFALVGLVGGPLVIVTYAIALLCGIPLIIGHVVYSIIAAIKVSEGQEYRYPFCIRFI